MYVCWGVSSEAKWGGEVDGKVQGCCDGMGTVNEQGRLAGQGKWGGDIAGNWLLALLHFWRGRWKGYSQRTVADIRNYRITAWHNNEKGKGF